MTAKTYMIDKNDKNDDFAGEIASATIVLCFSAAAVILAMALGGMMIDWMADAIAHFIRH